MPIPSLRASLNASLRYRLRRPLGSCSSCRRLGAHVCSSLLVRLAVSGVVFSKDYYQSTELTSAHLDDVIEHAVYDKPLAGGIKLALDKSSLGALLVAA